MDEYIKIKDLPKDIRPQEKLIKYGSEFLTNAELLALIIRTGNSGKDKRNVVNLAQDIIDVAITNVSEELDNYYGLKFLATASVDDLKKVKGVGEAKAAMIIAAIELGRRVYRNTNVSKEQIISPDILPNIVMDQMRFMQEEHFQIAILNTKKELESIEEITCGSIDKTIVEPRDVFKRALRKNAHSIVLLHNHPSGDPRPSKQDINITKRLVECGELIGIEVIDHIIIGDNKYTSLLEEGYM